MAAASAKFAERLYQQSASETPGEAPGDGDAGDGQNGDKQTETPDQNQDNVVDAEYEKVDDDKK